MPFKNKIKTILKITLPIIILLLLFLEYIVFNNGAKGDLRIVYEISPTPSIVTTTPTITSTPTFIIPTIPPASSFTPTLFVAPDGSDNNDGKSAQSPFKTIQKAVDLAEHEDVIELLPGNYLQDIITKKDGLPNQPIVITGPKSAIVQGEKNPRIFEINHSYITVSGFTIDGHYQMGEKKSAYRDKLIYVIGKYPKQGPSNVKILNMDLKNAGGECIRLRYFSQYNEIAYNQILRCGVFDFEFDGGGKNGEGVYIGTAPEQRSDGKNPTKDIDQSNNNWIHHNTIDTQGNECVDIKEGSSLNVVENNSCTGQRDPESGGLDARGDNNIFRHNNIFNNIGVGVRLGGDKKIHGTNNNVYENTIINNKSGGIKFQRIPQGKVCGNKMESNGEGNSVGSYGLEFFPDTPC